MTELTVNWAPNMRCPHCGARPDDRLRIDTRGTCQVLQCGACEESAPWSRWDQPESMEIGPLTCNRVGVRELYRLVLMLEQPAGRRVKQLIRVQDAQGNIYGGVLCGQTRVLRFASCGVPFDDVRRAAVAMLCAVERESVRKWVDEQRAVA